MMFSGTITLYNTVEVGFKKLLIPRLITGVHIEKTLGAKPFADGDKNADNLLLIIPFSGNEDVNFVVGDPVAIGDTGDAESFAELTARAEAEAAPGVFRISSVETYDTGDLKHWEIICK